jgi:hypothetical protein
MDCNRPDDPRRNSRAGHVILDRTHSALPSAAPDYAISRRCFATFNFIRATIILRRALSRSR